MGTGDDMAAGSGFECLCGSGRGRGVAAIPGQFDRGCILGVNQSRYRLDGMQEQRHGVRHERRRTTRCVLPSVTDADRPCDGLFRYLSCGL